MSFSAFVRRSIEQEPLSQLGKLTPTFYWAHILSLIVYGLLWRYGLPQPYENFTFRGILILIVCAGLVTHCRPAISLTIKSVMVYVVLFSGPYFCLTMWLMNGFSNIVWALTTIAILYTLFSCVRWRSGMALTVLATACAIPTAVILGAPSPFRWTPELQEFMAVLVFVALSIYAGSSMREQFGRLKASGARTALAVLAHEVRSPLFALRAGLFAMKAKADLANCGEKFDADFQLIDRLTCRIDDINETLNLHLKNLQLLNRDTPQLEREPVIVEEVIRAALEIGRASSNTPLRMRITPATVLGNKEAIRQVLCNLIRNAENAVRAKHAGEIFVCAEKVGNRIDFSIKDTAATLALEDATRIFEPFRSLGNDAGIGIGLYVSRILCASMGSTLGVSVGAGKTVFSFQLPCYRPSRVVDS